jgi:uncharacterized protein (DUF488 family)
MISADDEPEVTLYSIGHSDHALEDFIALLRRAGIAALADVRSQPYSRWVTQFNREALARALEKAGLTYVFLGDLLGGRPADPSLYAAADPHGLPDYARLAATPAFQDGLSQLILLARRMCVAMMCSEGDYHHCHRALLITPQLLARGVRVLHILPDGQLEAAHIAPQQLSLF